MPRSTSPQAQHARRLMRDEARRLLALRQLTRARTTLDVARWTSVEPYQVGRFHAELAAICDRCADAAVSRDMLSMTLSAPPRHGKTMLVGESLPIAAALRARRERKSLRILYVTAGAQRAQRVSLTVRSQIERIHQLTGDAWWAPSSMWQRSEWSTMGGLEWVAMGVMGATGGIGAHLLIGDDMIGHGETYRSVAKREAIWRALQEDLLSRRMGGVAINMETRRGIDDTTGRIHDQYGDVWEHHTWRCYDPDAGYLWPEVYGEAWRAAMPHLSDESTLWRSLYQQEPVPDGDYVIPAAWLEAEHGLPAHPDASAAYDRVVMGVDLAASGKTTADECAWVVIGCRGAYRDVLHVEVGQLDYPAQRRMTQDLASAWGVSTTIVELAANGDALVADLQAVVPGIRGERATKDKVARLMPHSPAMAGGQVRLPRNAPWLRRFREQLTGFTGIDGEKDDIVDAFVWAMVAAGTSRVVGLEDLADALDGFDF